MTFDAAIIRSAAENGYIAVDAMRACVDEWAVACSALMRFTEILSATSRIQAERADGRKAIIASRERFDISADGGTDNADLFGHHGCWYWQREEPQLSNGSRTL